MSRSQRIEMTFTCDQDWNEMRVAGQGRHCELCCRTVYDFSGEAINEIAESKGDVCGMFRVEQIERDLRPIEVPFSLRTTLITLGAVVGLEVSQANAQAHDQKPRVENVIKDSTTTSTTILLDNTLTDADKTGDCENIKPRVRRKYYFSKRFPFIVKRKTRIMGRFRM